MKIHWRTYNHCLFVAYLASVAIRYGWISDTKFEKFSDKDWIWIGKNCFGYGSGVKKSISAHLCQVDIRGEPGSGGPESTPEGFCVFLSDPEPESKICEKPDLDRSQFSISAGAGVCVVIS